MSEVTDTATVQILDKLYHVKCPKSQVDALHEAADFLDSKMQEITLRGGHLTDDRIALMAALNISHDLINLRKTQQENQKTAGERLKNIQKKINHSLTAHPLQIEL